MKKVSTAAAERLLALAEAAATSRWLCQGQTSPPPRLAEQGIRFGLNYVPRKTLVVCLAGLGRAILSEDHPGRSG